MLITIMEVYIFYVEWSDAYPTLLGTMMLDV